MKRMSTALHKGKIYLEAEGQADSGQWVFIGAVEILEETSANDVLGKAFWEVLERSKKGVPLPVSFEGPGNMALAAGCKSWPKFAKDAKSVSVELTEKDGIEFLPSRWEGPRKGGELLEEKAFFVKDADWTEIGEALRKAFMLCE